MTFAPLVSLRKHWLLAAVVMVVAAAAGIAAAWFKGPPVYQASDATSGSVRPKACAGRRNVWLARFRQRLAPPVAMGVGGLFDFYSGRIPRAPLWMREIGLEWVWRLLQEPGRMWRRYVIGNPLFLYRVWEQARGKGDPDGHRH